MGPAEAMAFREGKPCFLCGAPCPTKPGVRHSIDHNHETRVVRQVLCIRCNSRLGSVESPWWTDWYARALKYIASDGTDPDSRAS